MAARLAQPTAADGTIAEQGSSGYQPLADMNVTPLVDVMLVLLVIFMITAPLMTAHVPLNLPKASAPAANSMPEAITISLTKEGRLYLDKEEILNDPEDLRLHQLARERPDAPVHVRADAELLYRDLIPVLSRLGKAGLHHISLVTTLEAAAAAPNP